MKTKRIVSLLLAVLTIMGSFVITVGATDGKTYTWYTDTASAVAACDENHYVKLFVAKDVVLTKDCAVDLCGQSVNISGAYTLYGMDSSGDGYTEPKGAAIGTSAQTYDMVEAPNGNRYVAVVDVTKAATNIRNKTGDAINPIILLALIYLVIVVAMTQLLKLLERRLGKSDAK